MSAKDEPQLQSPQQAQRQPPLPRAGIQKVFADYIRQGETQKPPPLNIEKRRMAIYQGLISKNIESFLSGNFPVLKNLLAEDYWQQLVSAFLQKHRSSSPYFKDIAEEFLVFLNQPEEFPQELEAQAPVFMRELAHYEWVELVLDIRDADWPEQNIGFDFNKDQPLKLSPLAWVLAYQFPVHQICKDFQPDEAPPQPSCLVVYRNTDDQVKFMQINPLTYRMLEIVQQSNKALSAEQLLQQLAQETGQAIDNIYQHGLQALENFCQKTILGCISH